MIRTILISAALLASVGVAQAAELKVSIAGKSEAAIRADLNRAAQLACSDVSITDYAPCVSETYQNALEQVAKVKSAK
jgi:hypothetical protein